jgi:hypothetical protein
LSGQFLRGASVNLVTPEHFRIASQPRECAIFAVFDGIAEYALSDASAEKKVY